MPLHPRSFGSRPQTRAFWICSSCLERTSRPQHSLPPLRRCSNRLHLPVVVQAASFSASSRRLASEIPNHYQVLEIRQDAPAAEIKRQFYTLSKKHHPDHNADDPNASTRFVAISEAYDVLSVPEKRARYDAQLSHASSRAHGDPHAAQHHHYPQGSYSSASYAGSRPASGLNKKRSTFRGPPPSFYKAGGYGRHTAKRAEYAQYQHQHQHAHAGSQTEQNAGEGGFGPAGSQAGQANDVPHFDDRKHKQTHDTVYEHISARKRRARDAEIPQEFDKGGMLANFFIVSTVVGIAAAATKMFDNGAEGSKKANA